MIDWRRCSRSGIHANADVEAQYVWSPVYVNALILRDKDTNDNGIFDTSERLYVVQDANYNVTAVLAGTLHGSVPRHASRLGVVGSLWRVCRTASRAFARSRSLRFLTSSFVI